MFTNARTIVLWLFVVNLGVAFGAGVYEHRIVVPQWLITSPDGAAWNAEAARDADTGLRFWAFTSTAPLTLLSLMNMYAATYASGRIRKWWLAASATALTERLFTFAYFIPTMVGLMSAVDSPESVEVATRWSMLNHGRHVLVLAAWLVALQTFALMHRQGEVAASAPEGLVR